MKVTRLLMIQPQLFFYLLLFVLQNWIPLGLAGIQEPWVKLVEGFFDAEDCSTIIREAEKLGFPETCKCFDLFCFVISVTSFRVNIYIYILHFLKFTDLSLSHGMGDS
jgi:hypothetical protein